MKLRDLLKRSTPLTGLTSLLFFLTVVVSYSNAQTVQEAASLFDQGKYSEAETILNALVKENPQNAEAHLYLGKVYKVRNQFDRAERQMKRAVDIDPQFLDAYMELGRLSLDRPRVSSENRWRLARNYYKKAIKNIPTAGEALLMLFDSYVNTGEAGKGSQVILDFVQSNPDSLSSYLAYAELIKATEYNIIYRCEQLHDYYVKSLEYNPTNPKDLYNIGWGFFTCGDLDAALASYNKGLEYDESPGFEVFFDLMVINYELRVYANSLVYFLKGYNLMPAARRSLFTNKNDLPTILINELNRDFDMDAEEFLKPEWTNASPELILRRLRHYSIVWLRSKTQVERPVPLEITGEIMFKEPYIIHWGIYNHIDYAFHFLLDARDRERFLLYTIPEQRETFRERYFRDKDPIPTNEENELRDEFYRRVEHVYEAFKILPDPQDRSKHMRDFSGFDDRGRVYLKYGDPNEYYFDSGGTKRVDQSQDRIDMGLPPLLVDDATIGISQYSLDSSVRSPLGRIILVKANASWAYIENDRHLFFDFVEMEPGYFSVVDDLSEAAYGNPDGWLLYINRAELGNMTGVYEQYLYEYDRGTITTPGIFFSEYLVPDLHKKDEVIENYPTNIIDNLINVKPLMASLDYATFKGDNGLTRLEIYTGVGFQSLKFEESEGGRRSTTLEYEVIVNDVEVKPVEKDTISSHIILESGIDADKMSSIHQFQFELIPGQYTVDLHPRNPESGRESTYELFTPLPSYQGTSLMMSDVQLSAGIEPAQPGDQFVKNGFNVIPYPFRQIKKESPLSLYLEIYNLGQRPNGAVSFDISYTATVINENEGIVDKLRSLLPGSERTGSTSIQYSRQANTGPDFVEFMTFDLSNLIPGDVEIQVKITDNISGQVMSKSVLFRIY